jgi:hypothetical protein
MEHRVAKKKGYARGCAFATGLILVIASVCASAALIPGLYNTGVDDAGVPLPLGTVDLRYGISPAWVVSEREMPLSALSRWIEPSPMPCCSMADIEYGLALDFDLTGLRPDSARIEGRWATDNFGDIYLNGVLVPGSHSPSGGGDPLVGFGDWSSFVITGGFIDGVNTLFFLVVNAGTHPSDTGNPVGVRVEFISSSALAVPEPNGLALLALAFVALAVVRVRWLQLGT